MGKQQQSGSPESAACHLPASETVFHCIKKVQKNFPLILSQDQSCQDLQLLPENNHRENLQQLPVI
jgi:hypothetical protein